MNDIPVEFDGMEDTFRFGVVDEHYPLGVCQLAVCTFLMSLMMYTKQPTDTSNDITVFVDGYKVQFYLGYLCLMSNRAI